MVIGLLYPTSFSDTRETSLSGSFDLGTTSAVVSCSRRDGVGGVSSSSFSSSSFAFVLVEPLDIGFLTEPLTEEKILW